MVKRIFLFVAITLNLSVPAQVSIPGYVPTNALAGWWPFTGNAIDSSGIGGNGTVNGATLTTDRFNNVNCAYDFDGITDNIVLNGTSFASGANAKSVSLWFNITDSLYHFIISGGASTDGNAFGLFYNSNETLRLMFHGNSAAYDYTFANISLNNWYHTVLTYDGTNVKAYLNSVFIGSKTVLLNTTPTSNIKVGCRENGTAFFKGKIDDIGIWHRTLTQQEINGLYIGLTTGLNTQTLDNTVLVWPNPAGTALTISIDDFSSTTISRLVIVNSQAQEIFSSEITQNQFHIDLSASQLKGLYFLRIEDHEGNTITKKIVFE